MKTMTPQRNRKRILIVEDDPTIQLLLRHLLRPWFDLDLAVTVDEALNMAAQHPFDLFLIDINLGGTFLACRRVIPGMLEAGGGSIINLASVEGIEGFESGSAYNASKGAVMLLTRNMAIDYGRRGIRVNAICPGFIDTPMFQSVLGTPEVATLRDDIREAHQLGRFGKPEEIARMVSFLAGEDGAYITGKVIQVDGGQIIAG